MLRIWTVCIMLQLWSLVTAQPLSCREDAQCSEGYFCATQALVCHRCLQCQDLNRFVPELNTADFCIQTVESCGSCIEGFVNIYENHAKGQCVLPELLQYESKSYCVYVWTTAAITGCLLVAIFVYVFKNTFVYRIVPNCNPASVTSQVHNSPHVPIVGGSTKLKNILTIFKKTNSEQ